MNLKKHFIYTIITLIIFSGCKNSKYNTSGSSLSSKVEMSNLEENKWIASTIEYAMEKNNIPAVSIGVVRNGKVSYAGGFGELKRGSGALVNEKSIYEIASIAKTLTGIIASNLIHEGKLNLEEPITTYLEEILTKDAKKRLKNIKLKHLLSHKSGIQHKACTIYKNYQKGEDNYLKGYTEQELIDDINQMELDFEPGTKYMYSSSGYNVIGYICELVTKKTYEQLLKKYITDKYEMNNTYVTLNQEQSSRLVTAYLPTNRTKLAKVTNWGKATPASGIYSTVLDLSKLAIAQNQAYVNYISKGMNSPLILTNYDDTKGSHYGLGLSKVVKENYTFYVHEGDNDGFRTGYLFFPEHDRALVIFTSSGGPWMGPIASEIYHKIIDMPYSKPKKRVSIAQSVVDLILRENIESGIKFYKDNKTSKDYYVSEEEINQVGYALLNMERVKDAIKIFELNTEEFPNSSNVYDSLAEAYLKNGDKNLAILNYEKSLKINPQNKNAKEMISKLKI